MPLHYDALTRSNLDLCSAQVPPAHETRYGLSVPELQRDWLIRLVRGGQGAAERLAWPIQAPMQVLIRDTVEFRQDANRIIIADRAITLLDLPVETLGQSRRRFDVPWGDAPRFARCSRK